MEKAICKDCGKPIAWTGKCWDHIGPIKPKHIAVPEKNEAECPECGALNSIRGLITFEMIVCHNCDADLEVIDDSLVSTSGYAF